MQRASQSRDRGLGISFEREELARNRGAPACQVRLDRTEVTASGVSEGQILRIPAFRRTANHFIRPKSPETFLPYRRVTEFVGNSIRRATLLTGRRTERLAEFKATVTPNDETGLKPQDIEALLAATEDPQLSLLELAFDFGAVSGVTSEYVRAHGLFGKARANQVGTRRCWDCWGDRRGPKFVRSYYKPELRVHRLELQLNRKFLRRAKVTRVTDLWKLGSLLPEKHLWFAKVDTELAKRHMRMAGRWGRPFYWACERLTEARGDLLEQCSVLREYGGLKNVRRVLVPMKENALVTEALNKWLAQWSKGVGRG